MKVLGKEELIVALNRSVKELQQGIDTHTCLIASILGNRVDARNLKPVLENCPSRTREMMMKAAIMDAIEVLDESRKSFKSRQLETLRKRLTQVLVDASG